MSYTTTCKSALCAILFCLSFPAFAGYGYFGDCPSFISVNGTFYEAASCSATSDPFINGTDLGTVPAVVINYIEQQTWENGGDDVASGSLFYRVWTGSASGAFIEIPLTTTDLLGGGNEKRSVNLTLDIISGLAAGTTYTCEFYYTSSVNQNGGGTDAIFESNGGANYQFSFTTDAPVPVELTQFSTSQKQAAIALQWQTSSEINSSHFEVERSDDGALWTRIGQQESKGDFRSVQTYLFWDEAPLEGKNYYRLKMVDFGGREEYSSVRVHDFQSPLSFKLYPNPVKDQLFFQLEEVSPEEVRVEIYSASGQAIFRSNAVEELGSFAVATASWAPGLYVYRLVDARGDLMAQGRLLKL